MAAVGGLVFDSIRFYSVISMICPSIVRDFREEQRVVMVTTRALFRKGGRVSMILLSLSHLHSVM